MSELKETNRPALVAESNRRDLDLIAWFTLEALALLAPKPASEVSALYALGERAMENQGAAQPPQSFGEQVFDVALWLGKTAMSVLVMGHSAGVIAVQYLLVEAFGQLLAPMPGAEESAAEISKRLLIHDGPQDLALTPVAVEALRLVHNELALRAASESEPTRKTKVAAAAVRAREILAFNSINVNATAAQEQAADSRPLSRLESAVEQVMQQLVQAGVVSGPATVRAGSARTDRQQYGFTRCAGGFESDSTGFSLPTLGPATCGQG